MANTSKNKKDQDPKRQDLASNTENGAGEALSTNHGVKISDDQNSLKAGERGPSLLEDFILREKITHFDHERIPERIVHARGSAAHGHFEVYKSMARYTRAQFLADPSVKTPVFVRFSTVAGFRGSTDLARDVRGFAVKFYTQEGNFDLVGNNIPVFFIQDAAKFPDLIHAVKPEPHHEMPQAASAHDTFWDFISLMPESMHMVMWAMSDRAIPRSYRMMEGFGVHTFRLVNAKGEASFVKFHWKPLLGVHSVAWDEAQKISGKDADFHRRDLWEAIEAGNFPQWELGLQIVPEKDEHAFGFDLLDPTKLIPEELVPVQRVGKLTLNRNPDNFFAETEQVAFHPGHLVPGIDFTNDPLLQGRLFSYTDTQLSRLGGPNFHEIPVNRPVVPVHNNQRDGIMRQTINQGRVSYHPNSLGGGCPFQSGMAQGGFTSFPEPMEGHKVRARSRSFFDHFSQATLFYNSQSEHEKRHLAQALTFELGKVQVPAIRERMLGLLTQVHADLVARVADGLGLPVPLGPELPMNHGVLADAAGKNFEPVSAKPPVAKSQALSMAATVQTAQTRQVAILLTHGVDGAALDGMTKALQAAGVSCKLIAPKLGTVQTTRSQNIPVDMSFLTASSVLFDAVYLPAGQGMAALASDADALHFVNETYKHCKPIAADGEGAQVLQASYVGLPGKNKKPGVLVDSGADAFVKAIAKHRFWERETQAGIPA